MKKELWKTQADADEIWRLVVWLIADESIRRWLLLCAAEQLPVIAY